MSTFLELPGNIQLYLCKIIYARDINNLAQTCRTLHLRLNWELLKPGIATVQYLSSTLRDAASRVQSGRYTEITRAVC
ncbi:hypothetical protein BDV10DRAFT_51977 [Aspergillus recurvatus]